MDDIAPEITRQRLLIEGFYTRQVGEKEVENFLVGIAKELRLQFYGTPIVHAPEGMGKDENAGFDAFLPLIDSGISLYVWTQARFFATVLFTCKNFNTKRAVDYTREYFVTTKLVHQEF